MIFRNLRRRPNTIDASALAAAIRSLPFVLGAQAKTGLSGFSVSLTVELDVARQSDITETTMRALAQVLVDTAPSICSSAELRITASGSIIPRDALTAACAFIPNARIDSMGFVLLQRSDLREAIGDSA